MAGYDFAIIGGGAAGMAAAIRAAELGDRVILMEKGNALGKKIAASGNGRCNLMNIGEPRYFGDSGFAETILRRCGPKELTAFWRAQGLLLSEETEGRVYPCTFLSSTVLETLKGSLKRNHVEIRLQTAATECRKTAKGFQIRTGKETLEAGRILVCTGGEAQSRLGGCGDGYAILRAFGHRMIDPFPALCPVITDRRSIAGLAGIRVKCAVRLLDPAGEEIRRESGEVLFTEYGISGICIMQMARWIRGGGYQIELDPAGRLFSSDGELDAELAARRERFSEMGAENFLNGITAGKLGFAVMKQAGIPLRGEKISDLTDDQLRKIAYTLRHYRLSAEGVKGMEEAQVTAGGAACEEFSPENMESRLVTGLHAAGEVMNADGDCGGFNLMFAFAGGILAGENGRRKRG